MTLDDEILTEARELRGRLLELQRDAERTQADYHHAIRRLQAGGGSLREIAAELGLSHQRVHQIVGADAPAGGPARRGHRGSLLRFTRAARAVVEAAEEEARTLGHERVGTEHLLLGAAGTAGSGAAKALAAAGVDVEQLRRAFLEASPELPARRRRHVPYTRAAKRALRAALEESARLRTRWIGSEHVLLGLLAADGSGALDLLVRVGADPAGVREATLAGLDAA